MVLSLSPQLDELVARHSPYLRTLLEKGAERALRLHADDLTLEHVVGASFEDEESAAHEAVVHAFADPETLAQEALALSPGVMVVGSAAALPFSPLAVRALEEARASASAAGLAEVGTAELLGSAVEQLDDDARELLGKTGYRAPAPEGTGGGSIALEGSLFRHVSNTGKQVLSLANRKAHHAGERSIGPAWLALAALEHDPALPERVNLTRLALHEVLRGRTQDSTPPEDRDLYPDEELTAFLEALPAPAGSLEVLLACHGDPEGELAQLLNRHKVTQPLLERSRGAFEDPEG